MEKIIIEAKRLRAVGMAALGLLIFLAAGSVWMFGINEKNVFLSTMGVIFTLIFGIYFLILLTRAFESKPLLTITFDGIIDNSSANSVGYISFQDIEKFCIVSLSGKKVIGVIPKDEQAFINKLSPSKQGTVRANLNMNCPAVYMRVDRAQDISVEDIFTMLKKRLDDYSCLYD